MKMYILVNKNIKISKGKLAGQVGHAVNILTYRLCRENPVLIDAYMKGEIKKIILYAEEKLLQEKEQEGFVAVRDKGYTELPPNTLTCICLGIFEEQDIPNFVKELKLV
jgi:PTH2 family peptidyl-tRNA hydrolase